MKKYLKDSPTCSKEGLRIILALIAQKNGNWMSLISELFFFFCKEKKLIEKFSLCHPKKQKQIMFGNSKKCVYSLDDASHRWYNWVKSFLLSIGLQMSKGDPSIFNYYNNNVLQGLIAIFVDDFLWSSNNDFKTGYISNVHKNFVLSKEGHSVFWYLGLHPGENDFGTILDQMNYSENLKPIASYYDNESNSKDLLQSQIGKLLWISGQILLLMFVN